MFARFDFAPASAKTADLLSEPQDAYDWKYAPNDEASPDELAESEEPPHAESTSVAAASTERRAMGRLRNFLPPRLDG